MPTPNLNLSLLEAAQAQKHVTVNESLSRLDALTQLAVLTIDLSTPPSAPNEGDRHLVPTGAVDAWSGADGAIAVWSNAGWEVIAPKPGWRAHHVATGAQLVYDGARWVSGALAAGAAATGADVLSIDHTLSAGATSDIAGAIPDRSVVIGVTARVISPITGPISWRLGTPNALDRYGSGLGVALNSEAHGVTGAPVGYYGDTDLRLSADGGEFSGGMVRIAVHRLLLTPPALV